MNMKLSPRDIPASFPVRPLLPGEAAKDRVTCGTCGLSWNDAIPTGYTPTPSGRCPFESFHKNNPERPALTFIYLSCIPAKDGTRGKFDVVARKQPQGAIVARWPWHHRHGKPRRNCKHVMLNCSRYAAIWQA